MRFVVTTTRDNQGTLLPIAKKWAHSLCVECISRRSCSLHSLLCEQHLDAILVVSIEGPKVYSAKGTYFYHPGMSLLRIGSIRRGKKDHMVEAMGLKRGMKVLDCTLGMGADAVVASYVVGDKGLVVGLEASCLPYFVVEYGLRNYMIRDSSIVDALRRIKVLNVKAENYFLFCNRKFDVVYFDPMFSLPVLGSSNMLPFRDLAYSHPLEKETIDLALKIAPKVVVKKRNVWELKVLGCETIFGGKYSSFKFGMFER